VSCPEWQIGFNKSSINIVVARHHKGVSRQSTASLEQVVEKQLRALILGVLTAECYVASNENPIIATVACWHPLHVLQKCAPDLLVNVELSARIPIDKVDVGKM
jgi:hypothetical protein